MGDHLDNELAVSAALTQSGVEARVKSRFLSAVDRLLGAGVDAATPFLEGIAQRQRARVEADVNLIQLLGERRLQIVNDDPALAARILDHELKRVGQKTANKAAVIAAALQDLRTTPASEDQTASGPDVLSGEFTNRFETYAEGASTDAMRERWARILASEVRAPGTFSMKALRTVDEMDARAAQLFEQICIYRFGDLIPSKFVSLTFSEELALVDAGLIADPGITGFNRGVSPRDDDLYVIELDGRSFVVPKASVLPPGGDPKDIVINNAGSPAIPGYIVTATGEAIASILPARKPEIDDLLFELISARYGQTPIKEFRPFSPSQIGLHRIWINGKPGPVDSSG